MSADANRCSACERSLRCCCYTCPHCDRHEDTCEGVDAADGLDEAVSRMARQSARKTVFFRQMWRISTTNSVERRRKRDAARAEVHSIGLALGLRPAERIRLDGDAVHDRALGVVAELERLRAERDALSQLLRRMARRSVLYRRLAVATFRQLR